MFEHSVINASEIANANGKLTMVNNGTEYCNVAILNSESDNIVMHNFWTDSANDLVQFFINDKYVFGYNKYNMGECKNQTLEFGIQNFLLPAEQSFTVIFSRKNN